MASGIPSRGEDLRQSLWQRRFCGFDIIKISAPINISWLGLVAFQLPQLGGQNPP
jgi:hypothetical protein